MAGTVAAASPYSSLQDLFCGRPAELQAVDHLCGGQERARIVRKRIGFGSVAAALARRDSAVSTDSDPSTASLPLLRAAIRQSRQTAIRLQRRCRSCAPRSSARDAVHPRL